MKIINKEQRKIIQKMLEKYQGTQMIIAIEELSELQKEICKKLRNHNNINNENIEEEVADVLIVIAQIIDYYELNTENIEKIIDQKLQRTKERYLK